MGIRLQEVSFKYDLTQPKVLKDINLNINKEDEFIFMVGHTGSGKTTLAQIFNALLIPFDGKFTLYGEEIIQKRRVKYVLNTKKNRKIYDANTKKLFIKAFNLKILKKIKPLRRHIGLVFQFPEYQVFESTIIKDVMFGPKNYGASLEDARKKAARALRMFGFSEDDFEKNPFSLSGGWLRKVALAGIFACDPDIIILDEPTVGLDPISRTELMNLLESLQREYHKTIIIISHDMNLVAEYAKRVLVLDKGEIIFDNSPIALFNDEEFLKHHHLNLPEAARLAKYLKEKQLIDYDLLPLSLNELKTLILKGGKHE